MTKGGEGAGGQAGRQAERKNAEKKNHCIFMVFWCGKTAVSKNYTPGLNSSYAFSFASETKTPPTL